MNSAAPCPEAHDLHAFQRGHITGPDAQAIESHLQRCSACQTVLRTFVDEGILPGAGVPALDGAAASAAESFSFLLPAAGPDEIGRLGNYRVLRLLGRGGMALVFHAEDIALCRPVALKVMKPDLDREMGPWDRFLREARLMAAIKHDHLVTIYQTGQQGDICYFAMELLEGESLEDWIKRSPRPDVRDVLRLGRELASGLGFLHDHGLIHRDIKPANIWLEAPSGRVKILDLGLARFVKEDVNLTGTGAILGTPAFMSPEQGRGDPLDARSDLFSLGSVLYALCTGSKPFRGETAMAQLMALAADIPRPIQELNPRIPKSLADLVAQLLAKHPEERPASAKMVLQRLREIEERMSHPSKMMAATSSSQLRPAGEAPTALGSERRLRRGWLAGLTGLAALAALVLVLTLAASLFRSAPTGDKVYLTSLTPSESDKWPLLPKKGGKGPPPNLYDTISVGGKPSPRGIGMHPPPPQDGSVSVSYRLDQAYRLFRAEVSLNDTAPAEAESPLRFRVYGDGQLLWESKPVSRQDDTELCQVSVKDVTVLKLEVICAGSPRGAHGVWLEPHLVKRTGERAIFFLNSPRAGATLTSSFLRVLSLRQEMRMAAIPLWRRLWEPAPPLAELVPEAMPVETAADADRREADRHACHREAWLHPVSLVKSMPWHAIVMDLSATGIGLAIERPVPIGTFFAVELPDPVLGTTRLLRARVVHTTAQTHQYWHIGCVLVPELPFQDLEALL